MPESLEGAIMYHKNYCAKPGRLSKAELLEYIRIKN